MWDPTKNVDPIGSAVLTFIGYKLTDRPAKYLYRYFQLKNWNIT